MSSYLGTQRHKIDDKGRVAVPASMRRAAGRRKAIEEYVLLYGFDGCLALYPTEEWGPFESRLRQMARGNRTARAFLRGLLLDAVKVSVDAQGRIAIPPALMSRAGLGKEAVLYGQLDHIEIWSPDRLHAELTEAEPQLEKMAEEVFRNA